MKAQTMTDIEADHTRQLQELTQRIGVLCQQFNIITQQRDALLQACRDFAVADTKFEAGYTFQAIMQLLDEMQDVVTTGVSDE
jgi:ABC-type phosphate/phosphonate transport system ATPase subunit